MKERKDVTMPHNQIFPCVIKQYGTGLYRVYVSLDRNNTICLSTHHDESSATETFNRFLEAYQKGEIKALEDILRFINTIRSKDPAISLPVLDPTTCEVAA
jgi:hypothetical protein